MYAVRVGRKVGVFTTWDECHESVYKYPGARYKKFNNKKEAESFIGNTTNILDKEEMFLKFIELTPPNESAPKSSNESALKANDKPASKANDKPALKANDNPALKDNDRLIIYSDGACYGNGLKTAQAGIGVYFDEDDPRNLSERVPEELPQTSQVAELWAIKRVMDFLNSIAIKGNIKESDDRKILIYTDSMYSINCLTKWHKSWEKNNYMTNDNKPVKNSKLIQEIVAAMKGQDILLKHVRGHAGILGNERADKLSKDSLAS